MVNPFEYGAVVEKSSFCNRKEELEYLKRVFINSERLFLYSERRLGKTSLIKLALQRLPQDTYIAAYVDLWWTNNEEEFALALAKSVSEATTTVATKLIKLSKDFFGALKPSVTTDETGKPQLVFGAKQGEIALPALDEVLETLPKIASQAKKKLVLVFDEFQQIAEYKSDTVERRLRSIIQHHQEIAYVFLGSKKHLIQKMFIHKQRPLYRSAAHYALKPIAVVHWLPFIKEKFLHSARSISDAQIKKLCELTEGHPFYTQHLCHALWELTEVDSTVQDDMLEQAIELVLEQENYAFTTLCDSLAINQRILLNAIALAQSEFKPFGSDFVKHSAIGSASNVQRAAQALLAKDLIDRDEAGSFVIPDRFLKLWLQKKMSNGN